MKNKKGQGMKLGVIITTFIVVIVGIILLDTTSDSISATTVLGSQTNETVTTSSSTATVANVDNGGHIITFFGNETESTVDDENHHVIGVDVNITEAGVVTHRSNITDAAYLISYTYFPEAYVQDATSRTLMPLIIIFFVLAVFALAVTPVRESLFGLFK